MEFLDESSIEDFLKNKLSKADRAAFEQEMSRRPELAKEVEQFRKAMDFLDTMGDREMKQKMQHLHRKLALDPPRPKASRRSYFRIGLGVAAAVLLLLFAYWAVPSQQNPRQLYAQYYEFYPLSFSDRDADADIRLSQVDALYGEGQFARLPVLLDTLLAEKEDAKIRLALGISQMELGLFEQALNSLRPLIDQADLLYFDQALWYSALAHLKLEQVAEAEKLLKLQTKDSPFEASTEALLSEMKYFFLFSHYLLPLVWTA
ncbi:MAG: hypothetical protein AAF990_27125 [Bacteroidota bacterium]